MQKQAASTPGAASYDTGKNDMNNQPLSKVVTEPTKLDVHSIFYTLQGEGPFTGRPSVFLRLGGCNLRCPQCDTEYTEGVTAYRAEEVSNAVARRCTTGNTTLVVITGGEPFRQVLAPLITDLIIGYGLTVQIETNGTVAPNGFDHNVLNDFVRAGRLVIVCSPKTGKVNKNLFPYITAWKYVCAWNTLLFSKNGLPDVALDHPTGSKGLFHPPDHDKRPVYLSPADVKDDTENLSNLQSTVKACLNHGHFLSIQTHKLARLP